MKFQSASFLVTLVLLLSAALAWSQTGASDSSQSSPAESSPQQSSSDGPQPVFTHPEELPPLAMLGEVTAHSFINLGLGTSVSWDSNAAGFSYQNYSRTLFIVNPSLQLRQTRPTLTWYVEAFGGLTASTGTNSYNTASPSATAGFLQQINQHWQINANDSYFYTTNPFQQYLVYSSPPTYNQPNPTVYVPQATTQSNNGALDLTYQITAHDSLTLTGTESFRRYLHTDYSAYDLYSWGGVVSYQHQFSARLSAGAGYSFSSLDFGHGQSRSGVQQIQVFANYKIDRHMTVSGWLSPNYTATKNLIPILCTPYGCFIEVAHYQSWSNGFGGLINWSGKRNAFSAGGSKSISDGGVLLGIVQLYVADARFTRQLNPRWSLNAGMLYGDNTGYATRLHLQHLTSFTGNVGALRQITPALSLGLQYTYFYQTQKHYPGAQAPTWRDNSVQLTLQYNWGHSLGR